MMRILLLLLAMATSTALRAQKCNYIFKPDAPSLDILDADGIAPLVLEAGSVPFTQPLRWQPDWLVVPEQVTELAVSIALDYSIHPDTIIQVEAQVPLTALVCLDSLPEIQLDSFLYASLDKMYGLLQTFANDSSGEPLARAALPEQVKVFFEHNYYWTESYLTGDLLQRDTNILRLSHQLFCLSSTLWSRFDANGASVARLFAIRPDDFCKAYGLLDDERSRAFLRQSVMRYFSRHLYTAPPKNSISTIADIYNQYLDRESDARAALVLNQFTGYLQQIGLGETEIQSILSARIGR